MTDEISRRDWLKVVGVASAAGMVPLDVTAKPVAPAPGAAPAPTPLRAPLADGEIVPLFNTSEVFIPARGGGRMRFSFDFPEPSVAFAGYRFGFIVFTDENTYAPDQAGMKAAVNGDTMTLTCDGFTWAGGQEKSAGHLTATFRRNGTTIEWDATVEMPHPVKTVTAVVRDVPKGAISLAGNPPSPDQNLDRETLGGYTFGAGDLHGGSPVPGMSTPFAAVEVNATEWFYASSLDDRVRPKRFDFQAGESAYRLELVHEHDAWRNEKRITVPRWRIGRAPSLDAAVELHWAHLERAYRIPSFEARTDIPGWMRDVAMVVTMHGQHYTGFVFNTYAQQLEILRWIAGKMPAERVLIFLAAWDGRYYWDYPNYGVSERMGGIEGFRRLIGEGQKLGFKMMPMYGANSANRRQPVWSKIAGAETRKIDGDTYFLNWVDWNNDRHQDGWLTYMNLGAESWRKHLTERIAWMIDTFGVDAYFLDIVGGHVNSTTGDMHEGTRQLVMDLRRRYPKVLCVGEMPYDALYEFIAVYHAGGGARWRKYAHFFSHLSAPAPGRGSSGVHEAGFGRFNTETLGLNPNSIPTMQVVDDTFTKYRDTMAAIIAAARTRAGDLMAKTGTVGAALRASVLKANVELSRRGLAAFTFGNASAIDRARGLVVIKPSGVPYERMKVADLVVTDLDGTVVAGTLKPSSDLPTHLVLYRAWPAIGGIAHTHSHFANVWAQADRDLPCYGTTHADHFDGPVPITREMTTDEIAKDYERNTGKVIVEQFDGAPDTMPAVLVRRHGSFTWGATVEAAVETATILEAVARMAFHTALLNPSTGPLQQALLQKHFRRKHGPGAYYGQGTKER